MPLDQVDVDKLDSEKMELKPQEAEMSFLEHLEELRWHLVRSVVGIIVIGIVAFLFQDFVFNTILMGPKDKTFATYRLFCGISESICFYPPDFKLITVALGEEFFVSMKVAIVVGLIVAFPYVFWEMWSFIRPGLYPEEQKAARGMVFICSSLFLLGVLFGYFVISPFAVTFLASYSVGTTVESTTTLSSYVNYMTMFTLPTGIVFELPVVVYFLAKVGLIGPEFMRKYRRHAVVVILLLSAIITPPDVITQFLIGIPLFILYEISIHIAKRVVKNKEAELKIIMYADCCIQFVNLVF